MLVLSVCVCVCLVVGVLVPPGRQVINHGQEQAGPALNSPLLVPIQRQHHSQLSGALGHDGGAGGSGGYILSVSGKFHLFLSVSCLDLDQDRPVRTTRVT